MDIEIWIPKTAIKRIKAEYQDAIHRNLELNYKVSNFPIKANLGDKCFFGWLGFIRGFHIIKEFKNSQGFTCLTTGNYWSAGKYIVRDGNTIQWLNSPIRKNAFRGYKYVKFDYLADDKLYSNNCEAQ